MGDLFDRNVHPLYSVMAFVSALLVLLLLISGTRNKKGIQKNHRAIFQWVIFFCLQDGVWGLLAAHIVRNDGGLLCASNIFHLSAMFSAFAWTIYFLSRLNIPLIRRRMYASAAGLLLLVQLGMIIANLSSHFMFYVDENGWYQTTDYRAILFYLQFASYILIGIVSLVGTARQKKSLSAIFCVNLSPLLFSVFQLIYPDAPVDSIGFAIGCVIIELFLSREYEEQVYSLEQMQDQLANYKRAVLSDALISLEVNLSKDELYYGVWKDDAGNELPLKDILGLELPCSYDEYIKKWNRRFVKDSYSSNFSGKTDAEHMLDIFNSGSSDVTFDYEALTVSGRSAWLRRSISMVRNKAGDVIAFTSVKDISAIMEQAQREEAYIKALATDFDSIAVVAFGETKMDDKVVLQTEPSGNVSALLDEPAMKETCFSVKLDLVQRSVHPADQALFTSEINKEHILKVFETNRSHFLTFRLMKRDGSGDYLYYELRFIPLRIKGDKYGGMIACLRDVDQQVRKEIESRKELEAATLAAESASQAKTNFLFNMSHDIRTPMNAILGFTDIALRHQDDPQTVGDSLQKIKTSGGHLLNLINDILEMSRIESGTLELSEEPADLRRLIAGVEQMSAPLAVAKSIDFRTEITSLDAPYVYMDELHANEVLINLVSNAVKYTPEGGKVRFRVAQAGPAAGGKATYRFEVADSGIGMSEEFQRHVFEAFAREKSSTVSKQQGAGLGLSIVKNIVDLAGGTISVQSKPGEGSTFTVVIPLRVMGEKAIRSFEAENKPQPLAEKAFTLEGKKVLLVEDNEMNREIAEEILSEAGLTVDTAEDGLLAVKAVTAKGVEYYDFVLMDIQMPVMDGFTATRNIRALPGGDRLTIIALSANAFEEDVQRSLAAGMNAHVAKPVDVDVLFAAMQSLA